MRNEHTSQRMRQRQTQVVPSNPQTGLYGWTFGHTEKETLWHPCVRIGFAQCAIGLNEREKKTVNQAKRPLRAQTTVAFTSEAIKASGSVGC